MTQDAAYGLIKSFRVHHPSLPVYMVTSPGTGLGNLGTIPIPVEDVEKESGFLLIETLDASSQVLLALPFALQRILADHKAIAYVAPGCLVANPLDELARLLESAKFVLVSPLVPQERFSTTPGLVGLTRPRALVSTRALGIRDDAHASLGTWREAMRETFFDVFQRRPLDIFPVLLGSLLGEEDAGTAGESTLGEWVDFAAIESGRASGPTVAIVACDFLWRLGRAEATREAVEVEWQLLADKVHDSRPLASLISTISEAVRACPLPEDLETPFDLLAREVRRASDPLGVRWRAGDEKAFRSWLYETNTYGLTRIAHLYWQSRPDLHKSISDIKFHPQRIRAWNDRRAIAEFGMDLFDASCAPRHPEGTEEPAQNRILHAIRWRSNVLKGLVPGYQARQIRKELGPDPRRRRGVAPPRRVEVARQPPLYGSSPRQLSIIGCFRAESGLGQAARASLSALRLLGREFSFIDTSEEYPSRNAVDAGLDGEIFGAFGEVNLVHSNADEMLTLGERVFRNRLAGRFNVGMWFWEAADLPERSRPAFDVVDELWVASNYLADVFGQYGKVPVNVIGLAAELPSQSEATRTDFGLSEDEFLFLFVYDALSSHGRKNPEKALEAFVRAFAPEFEDVRFVLKVSNLNKFPASQRRILAMAERYPAISVIDEYFTRERVMDLMGVADVFVSLHAAEGFGFTLLESMALGTPAICTAYSGNMDFTTPANSWLVDYHLIATQEQTGPYPAGSVWALPSVDSAAELMRAARDHPATVERKQTRAIHDAWETASLDRYAARLDSHLDRVL